MNRVFLTGASGFTGGYVARALAAAGYQLKVLVRDAAKGTPLRSLGAEVVVGDLDQSAELAEMMRGWETLVNVASIGYGHAPGVVAATQRAGMERAVYFSSTSLFTHLPAASKAVRLAAEQSVRSSPVPAAIVRPTMIYGDPADRNLIRLIRYLDRCRLLPVPGPGTYLQQPVYVKDLADAMPKLLQSSRAMGQDYDLSGGTVLTYNELVLEVGRAMGIPVRLLHVPVGLAQTLAATARRIGVSRVSREQILRLNEDKIFDYRAAVADWGYAPTPFACGIAAEVAAWRTACNSH